MNQVRDGVTPPLATLPLDETRTALLSIARGRFGRISPERIVEHVLRMTDGADWPVRKAALEALRRRYSFGQRDGIRIKKRPIGSRVLGSYRVAGSKRSSASSRGDADYETALLSIEPLRASCGCADFVRASLGLCKHALIVLEALGRSRALSRPVKAHTTGDHRSRLIWSASHPLTGPADRLARLELVRGTRGVDIDGFTRGRPLPSVLRAPARRHALIRKLDDATARGRLEVEPAVATLLAEERERAERCMQAQTNAASAGKSLSTLRRTLYPYQIEGVRRIFERGRLLLADDMGLGKTTQAIAACHGLFRAGCAKRGLLIVPAALKSQWKREWDATSPVPLSVVDGSPAERAALYRRTARGFLVIGYEQLLRDFESVRRFAPAIVVLDEAQRIICNGLAQLRFEDEWPRCSQTTRPTPALLESLCTPKLAALRELVEQIVVTQNRKAIVFSQWRNMLRLGEWAVRDLLADAGRQTRFFTGAESAKARERSIVDFHDDPAVSVLFLSDAGGVGLNLQRAATCCINLEMPWNPAVLEQRIGRIYRLGQTQPIDVYNLVTDSGIEPRIAQLVANKRAVFSSLFDGTTDAVRFDGSHSFLDGVKRLLDAPPPPEITSDESLDDGVEQVATVLDGVEEPAADEAPPLPVECSDNAVPTLLSVLSSISLAPQPDGKLRLDVPAEVAAPLATLLETLARSLRSSLPPPV